MPIGDFKPVTYTAKELELIDLALDALNGDRDKSEAYQRHRQQCALERYHRRNPEWKQQFTQAHKERARANERYWTMYKELEVALGHAIADQLDRMLNDGQDPFA